MAQGFHRDFAAPEAGGPRSFFDLYAHGFVRLAAAVPQVALADPAENGRRIEALYREAGGRGAAIVVFPELCLTGYSIDDLLQQDALQDAALVALAHLRELTASHAAMLVVGAPLRFSGRLFNCAIAMAGGRVLGVVPKTFLPNYREFYEKRHFTAGPDAGFDQVRLLGESVPFGNDLLFADRQRDDLVLHLEICEDVWTPIPPSTLAAMAGATLLANLSASNATIGKSGYRRELVAGQSAKTLSAYLYTSSGQGESTTDLAWDGHALIFENGGCLAESERFAETPQLIYADVDLDRLVQERSRQGSWADCAARQNHSKLRKVDWTFHAPPSPTHLNRSLDALPYVPDDEARRAERCAEVDHIQVTALAQRLRAARIEKLVIGVSGGLDSTQALLVCAKTMDRLGLPRTNILAYTMPGFATSAGTKQAAHDLMNSLGVTAEEIDIRPSCLQMLRDLGHPFADGEPVHDVTFENVQAGERTSHLFRLANHHGAIVVGTGDLSELALGWCTYGVGDQMSHYNVNASVPKTLIRYLIEWEAQAPGTSRKTAAVLRTILDTEISPELVPPGPDGKVQSTEGTIGPYELHDFALYSILRRGYRPSKIAYLLAHAWSSDLPISPAAGKYPMDEILRWLRVFLWRFFQTSQFKRSALPNGPKVGSGGSLSPRGDWRAPSDSSSAPWIQDFEACVAWLEQSRTSD
ncbi:MAG: NAD(+) synthase [Planctomycetota bacterium]